ncbi:hypothetical protein GCM10020258_44040 [Sphingomonas yabuuchiae]
MAANTAGGSHHALANTGAGYCVFNDLAVAAVRLVEQGVVGRVAIVDCDVHQGDGTAALTAGRPDIVTYSIHAEKNFPARKARSTLDVGLPDGVDDDGYLAELAATLTPFLDEHRPDIILYQAGVDPFVEDRLGRLSLTREGLIAREKLIADLALARGFPSPARSAAAMAMTSWRSRNGTSRRSRLWAKDCPIGTRRRPKRSGWMTASPRSCGFARIFAFTINRLSSRRRKRGRSFRSISSMMRRRATGGWARRNAGGCITA